MQVFKTYFIIIKKHFAQMSIYLLIFLALSFMLSTFNSTTKTDIFNETKIKITFINNDEDSIFLEGFKEFLTENAIMVDIENQKERIQDALFFRRTEYIIKAPKGFTKDFLSKKDVNFEKISVPLSSQSVYMDMLINKYLNAARLYINAVADIKEQQLSTLIKNDLDEKTKVALVGFSEKDGSTNSIFYYFNYLAYSLFAILILGVSTIMIVFNKRDLKMRNLCSPLTSRSINFQLLLGNLVFALSAWLIFVSFSFVLYRNTIWTTSTVFLLINSLIFTFCCLSISFLVGNAINSRNVQAAVSNVLTLGTCFISGVFVPQELLGENVLKIAKFTPTYWFVKTNSQISKISNFNFDSLAPIFYNMLIVLAFTIGALVVAFIVIKKKRRSN